MSSTFESTGLMMRSKKFKAMSDILRFSYWFVNCCVIPTLEANFDIFWVQISVQRAPSRRSSKQAWFCRMPSACEAAADCETTGFGEGGSLRLTCSFSLITSVTWDKPMSLVLFRFSTSVIWKSTATALWSIMYGHDLSKRYERQKPAGSSLSYGSDSQMTTCKPLLKC